MATLVLLAGGALLSLTLAVTIGPVPLAPARVWQIIAAHVTGDGTGAWTPQQGQIVWLIRLPRVLLAFVVGAGLATVGVVMQAAVRNPLADPYILGLSSGASVGAAGVLIAGWGGLGGASLSVAAFVAALATFVVVYALARYRGRLMPVRLILAGVAVYYVCSAATSFIVLRADDLGGVQAVLFWLSGSLAGAKWSFLGIPTATLVAGTVLLLLQARPLNALLVGDETAATLGVDVQRLRRRLLVLAALLTGVMVAVSGAIGFVGLLIPHMVRLVMGSDHRRVLPVAALSGGIFLIWVDVLARMLIQPTELPIGIVTAFFGAPFFLWLLRRRAYRFGAG